MRRAVVTRSDRNVAFQARISHPQLKEYARQVYADFLSLTHESPVATPDSQQYYRSLKLRDLLGVYDRIVMIDSDVNLNLDRIPDIFSVVPPECVGAVAEDVGSRRSERLRRMETIQAAFGRLDVEPSYVNCGLIVVSRHHRRLFESVEGRYWTGDGNEDAFYSYQIAKHRYSLFKLHFMWNHMTMFSEPWNGRADRFESYIIHYAGHGVFDRCGTRTEQMWSDARKLHGRRFEEEWH
jgi:lipopolysaccharide biosynthesis glycosyltransferase